MKKFKLLPLVAMVLLLGSCKKDNVSMDEQPQTSSILNQSAAVQVKYAETNLKKIANGFAKLAKNPAFVQYLHSEVAQKFDGQFEVLIEHLLLNPTWGTQLRTQEVKEGVAAFKNLKGQNFYPQIYIPKMQNNEDNQVANVTNNTTSTNTTSIDDVRVVIYGGAIPDSSNSDTKLSYEINEDGVLVAWQVIGEPYANNNEVWVFSLNEVMDPEGRLTLPENPICTNPEDPQCFVGGGGGGTGGGSGSGGSSQDADPAELSRSPHPAMNLNVPVSIKIENMIVKQHKESWLGGWSEIAIKAALNTINGRDLGNPAPAEFKQYSTILDGNGRLGRYIKAFSRRQIRNETNQVLNFELQTGWPTSMPISDPVYFDFVIFERDYWPTGTQNLYRQGFGISFNNLTDYYDQRFRSADGAYEINRIVNNSNLLISPVVGSPIFYNNGSSSGIDNSIAFNIKPF